jgi:hypothetical protein
MVQSSRALVKDGIPVLPKLTVYEAPPGEQISISLPVCDQPGYSDGRGNPIDAGPGAFSHYYHIATSYLHSESVAEKDPTVKVAISTDDLSPIDIDDLIYFQNGKPAEIIYVPDIWSAQVENIPILVNDTMEEWLAGTELPTTAADLNVLGWPEFIILEHDTDSTSVPDGAFIVRLPEDWTP